LIRVPYVAEISLLVRLLGNITGYVHLYRNDVTITTATTLGDLVEMDVPGYSAQPAVGWTGPVIVSGRAVSAADPILFTRSAGLPSRVAYGYYVTDGPSGDLLWVQRGAEAPYPFGNATDTILVIPRLTLRQEP